MAEAGKDCGVDSNVNERTQTNVCKEQQTPSIGNVRLMMSVEGEKKGRRRVNKREKPSLEEIGLSLDRQKPWSKDP